jgi:protein TonB
MVEKLTLQRELFAGAVDASWGERARRGWVTLTSFGLQALVVVALLIVPLLRPSGFPSFHQLTMPISLGPLGEAPVVRAHAGSNVVAVVPSENALRLPTHIPRGVVLSGNDTAPPIGPAGGDGIRIPGGDPGGAPSLLGIGTRPIIPVAPPTPVAHSVRLSYMSEGDLIRKVQPSYPPLARAARIQGTVLLQALISKQGTIEHLQLISGHPMLVQAAMDAVRQWRYRPYVLNGEPVEVETQITVNFSLAGS